MSKPGMWMPKQKDGKNWEVIFSVEVIYSGEKIVDRRKSFRVQDDARQFINEVRKYSEEAKRVKEPRYRAFVYSQPKKIGEQA